MDISTITEAFDDVAFSSPSLGVVFAAVLAAVLLLVSAFASGSEIAFFSLSPTDVDELEDEKTETDRKILMLREDSERTLATILIANNFVNVTIIMLLNYVFAGVVHFGAKAYWLQFQFCLRSFFCFLVKLCQKCIVVRIRYFSAGVL